MRIALLALTVGLCSIASAQKAPVYFSCTCDDQIGQRFATAFRDAIAQSPRYERASEAAPNGTKGSYSWVVRVVSIDPYSNRALSGTMTTMSVVYMLGPTIYINHQVQSCGASDLSSCARDTLAGLDEEIEKLR